jgi:hypothetical protein
MSDLDQATNRRCRRRVLLLATLAVCALPVTLLPAPAMPAGAAREGESAEAEALRLARRLPGDARRLDALREPAGTVEAQLGVALDELGRMSALTYDPHYLPAVFAVGRAFVAASGRDPLTRTPVNPEYLGLGTELAGSAGRLDRAADDAGSLAAGVRRLNRKLVRSQRHARLLERRIERLRAGEAG